MRPDSIRCFVAIEIPEKIQALLAEIQDTFRPKIEKASWTKQGNFHLTLKFLRDVESRTINEINAALQKIAENQTPFSIQIGGIGAFPNLARPRVLWAGLKQGTPLTVKLARAINHEFVKFGFEKDTRFHPHFTLARLKDQVNLNTFTSLFQKFEILDGAPLTVDKITLVKSELYPSGAVYTPLKICKFGQGESC